jgi:hypothetical protein
LSPCEHLGPEAAAKVAKLAKEGTNEPARTVSFSRFSHFSSAASGRRQFHFVYVGGDRFFGDKPMNQKQLANISSRGEAMAKVDRSHLRKAGEIMSPTRQPIQVPAPARKAPVRVKLERINCDVAKSLPPDGDQQVWLDRLMTACGSSSPDFVQATLFQLQAAARLPNSGLSETALNAALAMIESEQPRGEAECAVVVQMACLHSATMAVLARPSWRWPRW